MSQEHPWKLEYSGSELRPRGKGDELFLIRFADVKGNEHTWAAPWDAVRRIYLSATACELANRPDSEWLERFAEVAGVVKRMCEKESEGAED